MLRAVNDAVERHGGGWVRLMYAYPSTFTDPMIDALATLPRLVKYLDIPLQHASDRLLRAMRRNVTASRQRDLILKLRERIPGLAVRTTFITGFPGETEDDHEELLAFIDEMAFDAMGVFEYSPEDHTPAGRMHQDPALRVPDDVKARRRRQLMELQQRIAFDQAAFLAQHHDEHDPDSGMRFDVLIDTPTSTRGRATTGVAPAGTLHKGRCYFQAPDIDSVTYVHAERPLAPGELVRCTITASRGYDLVARADPRTTTSASPRSAPPR
jgi:ribosomal protein S12 methylthiotransferase